MWSLHLFGAFLAVSDVLMSEKVCAASECSEQAVVWVLMTIQRTHT